MSRNSSGTYSLPPGNPVISGTVISSTWANTTLNDIAAALTDSLSRSGDGGMQAPLELVDGAAGTPALTWASETTSGWYRAGAGDFRFSISGTDEITLTASGLSPSAIYGTIGGSPTWSGTHTFTGGASAFAGTGVRIAGGNAGQIIQSNSTPAANSRVWDVFVGPSGSLTYRALDDANTASTTWLTVARTGTVVNTINFTGGTLQYNGNLVPNVTSSPTWTGQHTFAKANTSGSPPILLSSTSPNLAFNETDGAADNRWWYMFVNAEQLQFGAENDAHSVGTNWLTVDRTGTTIDAINFPTTAPVRIGTPEAFISSTPSLQVFGAGTTLAMVRNTSADIETIIGSTGTGAYVGTASNHPTTIYTNNAARVTIAASGDVSATGALTATGTITSRTALISRGTTTGVSNTAYVSFQDSSSTEVGWVGKGVSTDQDVYLTNNVGGANVRLTAGGGGAIIGTASQMQVNGIHNGTAPTGAANQYIASGTYTPTLTAVTNVSNLSAVAHQWMRVGNVVTVSGNIAARPGVTGAVSIGLTLPIASALTLQSQGGGGGLAYGSSPSDTTAVGIAADATNDRMTLFLSATAAMAGVDCTLVYSFTYLVV